MRSRSRRTRLAMCLGLLVGPDRAAAPSGRHPTRTRGRRRRAATSTAASEAARTSSSAASSSSMVAKPIALRASGRSMVTTATRPSTSTRTPPGVVGASGRLHSVSSDRVGPEQRVIYHSPFWASCRLSEADIGISGKLPSWYDLERTEAGMPARGQSTGPPTSRRPRRSRRPGTSPSPGGTSPRATGAGRGPSASTRGSAPPRSPTSATGTCSTRVAPGCRWRSTCRPSAATTPTTPTSRRRSAGSASRSTRSPTPRSCSTRSRSIRSRTSFTINGTAAILLAFYVAVGEKQGVDRAKLARHDPERHPQGVRQPRHVDLAAPAVAAPDRRHDRVLRRRGAAVQRHLGRRRALPRRRGQRRAGDGVHAHGRDHVLRRGDVARPHDHRRVRPAGVVLLLHARRLLRGDRQVPGRPPSVGARSSGSATARTDDAPACSGSACVAGGRVAVRAAGAQQHRAHRATRRSPRCWVGCSRCSRRRGTSRSRCRARSRPRSRCGPSRSSPTRRGSPGSPIRSAAPTTSRP